LFNQLTAFLSEEIVVLNSTTTNSTLVQTQNTKQTTMGCGSSKTVMEGTMPTERPAEGENDGPRVSKVTVKQIVPSDEAAANNNKRNTHSAKSNDSGISENSIITKDDNTIITELTDGSDSLVGDRPPTPELSVGGMGYEAMRLKKERDTLSAVSTKSAPSVLERPKSRSGAVAFELTFDNAPVAKRPARLAKLETRGLHREQTLAELQAKMEAAEARRKEYERRVKNKMAQEAGKVEHASMSMKREKTTLGSEISKSEDKAALNRERHLKQLRDKLKAKEEKAKRVRANKKKMALQNSSNTAAVAAT